MSPHLLEQHVREISLQIHALSARRAGTLAAITVGAPRSVERAVVVQALRHRLGGALGERVSIHVDEGMDDGLELMSLEFTWCR